MDEYLWKHANDNYSKIQYGMPQTLASIKLVSRKRQESVVFERLRCEIV